MLVASVPGVGAMSVNVSSLVLTRFPEMPNYSRDVRLGSDHPTLNNGAMQHAELLAKVPGVSM